MISLKSYLSRDNEVETDYRRIVGCSCREYHCTRWKGIRKTTTGSAKILTSACRFSLQKLPRLSYWWWSGERYGRWKITTSAPANLFAAKTQNCTTWSPCSPRRSLPLAQAVRTP